jgi:hypothetical protein
MECNLILKISEKTDVANDMKKLRDYRQFIMTWYVCHMTSLIKHTVQYTPILVPYLNTAQVSYFCRLRIIPGQNLKSETVGMGAFN